MDIKVKGKQVLSGQIFPSGSKNSAVHLIPCSLLINGKVTFQNIPDIVDVERLFNLLGNVGSVIEWDKKSSTAVIDNSNLKYSKISGKDVEIMKGTSLLLGALLARFGKVDFGNIPGGCTLGIRPLEPILKVFKDVGAVVKRTNGGIQIDLKSSKAGEVWLSEMSPTATTNIIMLATSLPGKTKIIGAASEPQVQDVCNFLVKSGVKIQGIGSSVLEIDGCKDLKPVTHKLLSDHYEIATFLALGACTGGEIKVHEAMPEMFRQINYEFSKFNVEIEYEGNTAIVRKNQDIKILGRFEDKTNVVRAQPWPSLPIDLLPIFIPLALASSDGYMMYHNWMYESGLFWTSELNKLGAEIVMCDPHRVLVFGGKKLKGAVIEAPYIIRAVVAMVMSAMIAEGESLILNADALYRGHPNYVKNLRKLGAVIKEVH